MLWIRDIFVRIRVRGSVPLTYGIGSCYFCQCQQKIIFCSLLLQVHLHYTSQTIKISKSSRSNKTVEIEVFDYWFMTKGSGSVQIMTDPDPTMTTVIYWKCSVLGHYKWIRVRIHGFDDEKLRKKQLKFFFKSFVARIRIAYPHPDLGAPMNPNPRHWKCIPTHTDSRLAIKKKNSLIKTSHNRNTDYKFQLSNQHYEGTKGRYIA